jgi:hypothetical protein
MAKQDATIEISDGARAGIGVPATALGLTVRT